MTCRTTPIVDMASALRCMSQNQLLSKRVVKQSCEGYVLDNDKCFFASKCRNHKTHNCCACSGVLHVLLPARKKGEDLNSCVLEYRSSQVPLRFGGTVVALLLLSSTIFGALDSRSLTNCFTCSFWAGFAYCPRSVDAAIRRMEFWITWNRNVYDVLRSLYFLGATRIREGFFGTKKSPVFGGE